MQMENKIFEKPSFFHYPKKLATDYGFETLQDFMLSWTFRWAEKKYALSNPNIYEYSRKILFGLILGIRPERYNGKNLIVPDNFPNNFEVEKVEVYRQWKQIDLIVEIDILFNNERSQYVLNIENKWYTNISEGQLERAAKYTFEEYAPNRIIKNYVIYCDNCKITESLFKQCYQADFTLISVEDLQQIAGMDSEHATLTASDLFDEYWLKHLLK